MCAETHVSGYRGHRPGRPTLGDRMVRQGQRVTVRSGYRIAAGAACDPRSVTSGRSGVGDSRAYSWWQSHPQWHRYRDPGRRRAASGAAAVAFGSKVAPATGRCYFPGASLRERRAGSRRWRAAVASCAFAQITLVGGNSDAAMIAKMAIVTINSTRLNPGGVW